MNSQMNIRCLDRARRHCAGQDETAALRAEAATRCIHRVAACLVLIFGDLPHCRRSATRCFHGVVAFVVSAAADLRPLLCRGKVGLNWCVSSPTGHRRLFKSTMLPTRGLVAEPRQTLLASGTTFRDHPLQPNIVLTIPRLQDVLLASDHGSRSLSGAPVLSRTQESFAHSAGLASHRLRPHGIDNAHRFQNALKTICAQSPAF